MHHELKSLPAFFQPVLDGRKNFEIRYNNDRGFQTGDTVELREYDLANGLSGRTMGFVIGYVTPFEQKPGWVVFSLLPRLPPQNEGSPK